MDGNIKTAVPGEKNPKVEQPEISDEIETKLDNKLTTNYTNFSGFNMNEDNVKIKINGKVVKSSSAVKENDILEIEYFNRYIKAKIVTVPSGNVGKADASDLIEIMETKKIITNDEDLVREDSLEDL